jgi:hypothetical protein
VTQLANTLLSPLARHVDDAGHLVWLAAHVKHDGFREEQEWRTLWGNPLLLFHTHNFRATPTHIIQTCNMRLCGPDPGDGFDVLAKVRVGPSPHSALYAASIETFLRHHWPGANVEVDGSQNPYRP